MDKWWKSIHLIHLIWCSRSFEYFCFKGALSVWHEQMRRAKATLIMTTGWRCFKFDWDQDWVPFKTGKQGTCFSPMWRRLARWWQNWGRYFSFLNNSHQGISVWTILIKESQSEYLTEESFSGSTGLGRHAQNCALVRYQGQILRFVLIFGLEMFYDIELNSITTTLNTGSSQVSVEHFCSGFWNWFCGGANGVGLYRRHWQVRKTLIYKFPLSPTPSSKSASPMQTTATKRNKPKK